MVGRRTWILGCDPGLTGALAFVCLEDPGALMIHDIPISRQEIDGGEIEVLIRRFVSQLGVIERNWGRINRGSVFRAAAGYGFLKSILLDLIPCQFVAPTTWRAHFHLLPADKDLVRHHAMKLWPQHARHFMGRQYHGRADAALIARYGADALFPCVARRGHS